MPDEELDERLRSVLAAVDPVPPAARAAASAALGWRDLDAELAALTADSLADSLAGEGVGAVRGAPPRLLSFATEAITIDLEVSAEPGGVRLLGQLAPARPARIVVEYSGGSRTAGADEMGRFGLDGLPAQWLRVRVEGGGPGRARSHTEWFRA